jgi:hypothetical protein
MVPSTEDRAMSDSRSLTLNREALTMSLFTARVPKHAAARGKTRVTRALTLAASMALGTGLVIAPLVNTLAAGTADASPPVISAVGATAHNFGAAITTLSVNPQTVGDVLVVMDEQDDNAVTTTSLSGGGVTTWSRAIQYVGTGEPREYELWYGQVTSTGSSTITFTLSGSIVGHNAEYEAQEFTAGLGSSSVWTLDTTNHQENSSSTTLTYPSLTPAGAGELYFGFIDMPNPPSAGSTPGVTYYTTPDANQIAYDPASGSGALQPTSTQGSPAASSAIALFMSVHASMVAPSISGLSPTGGSTAGGTSVTISGSGFTGATAVDFGSNAATGVSVNSDSQIVATSPSGSLGTVDVTVTTPAGTSGFTTADHYTYISTPAVTGVSPSAGPLAGGTSVTVTGVNLSGASAVRFGGTSGTGVVVNSATSVTATSPAKSAGTVDVTVVTPGGTTSVTSADQFTYEAVPTVSGVSPSTGPSTGGTSVTVTGTNLTGATAVDFGTTPGSSIVVNGGGTSLAAKAPSGAGTVDVTVVTPGGTSATSAADQFTYQNSGYWMAGNDGSVFSFGGAPFEGSLPSLNVHVKNIVAMVPTADGKGYWLIGSDGGVFAFGDAGFVGSIPGLNIHVNDIVAAVPTSTGKGYWMVGADGGVFAFGDAGFVGSVPGLNIHVKNIVGAVPTSTGKGYWMVGADGGVFAFGNAGFVGSLPGINVHVANVVGVVATLDGQGYWMVGSDGGVFAFGDAGFVGSIPGLGIHVNNIVAFARQ